MKFQSLTVIAWIRVAFNVRKSYFNSDRLRDRNVLGELIFACVICRLDIGYSVCLLARFSDRPHEEHFDALKGICKYLRRTKLWGIMYRRCRDTG